MSESGETHSGRGTDLGTTLEERMFHAGPTRTSCGPQRTQRFGCWPFWFCHFPSQADQSKTQRVYTDVAKDPDSVHQSSKWHKTQRPTQTAFRPEPRALLPASSRTSSWTSSWISSWLLLSLRSLFFSARFWIFFRSSFIWRSAMVEERTCVCVDDAQDPGSGRFVSPEWKCKRPRGFSSQNSAWTKSAVRPFGKTQCQHNI